MVGRIAAGAVMMAALVACTSFSPDGTYAPIGVKRGEESVDGLIVGHRLMAAGQYELALDAYLRAGNEQGLTVDVLSAVGSANLRLGRLGQAETILREAIDTDGTFVPAWNNLGVTLMEMGLFAEAERTFQTAFAIDSGRTVAIRDNLQLASEKNVNPAYDAGKTTDFSLIRRGSGGFLLLTTPQG